MQKSTLHDAVNAHRTHWLISTRAADEELAVVPVAARVVLDERPHDLQVAGEDRDVERFQSNPLHVLGENGQQVLS